uniref:C2H2-type domain-containing protein n=1 Tax=Rhipicephalus zambeziensis TaxID=60191 RepID=A0A224YRA9_9ACAR
MAMMFMDTSGVPAIAGPSNYHPDKQQSTPSHGRAAARFKTRKANYVRRPTWICRDCHQRFRNRGDFYRHVLRCVLQAPRCGHDSPTAAPVAASPHEIPVREQQGRPVKRNVPPRLRRGYDLFKEVFGSGSPLEGPAAEHRGRDPLRCRVGHLCKGTRPRGPKLGCSRCEKTFTRVNPLSWHAVLRQHYPGQPAE